MSTAIGYLLPAAAQRPGRTPSRPQLPAEPKSNSIAAENAAGGAGRAKALDAKTQVLSVLSPSEVPLEGLNRVKIRWPAERLLAAAGSQHSLLHLHGEALQ